MNFFIPASAITLIIIGIFVYRHILSLKKRNRQLAADCKTVLLETRAFSSQMNPHFVYNSLSAAQYLIMINENKKAFDYLSDFSLLLRQMFENAKKPFVELKDEIDFLQRYIELEKLRFNNNFTCSVNLQNFDETKSYGVPPMLLQPLVENAIRHGLAPKKQNGKLKIEFYVTTAKLVCTIDDNGIGLKKKPIQYVNNESSALFIINERIKLIAEKTGTKSYMHITDKKENGSNGVLIEIALPIENNY